jgi:hypothetical protein
VNKIRAEDDLVEPRKVFDMTGGQDRRGKKKIGAGILSSWSRAYETRLARGMGLIEGE